MRKIYYLLEDTEKYEKQWHSWTFSIYSEMHSNVCHLISSIGYWILGIKTILRCYRSFKRDKHKS